MNNRYTRKFCLSLISLLITTSGAIVHARVDQPAQFVNLSARGQVGSGEEVLVGGFVLSAGPAKQVLLRAVGPALEAFGVSSRVGATRLTLYQGSRVVATSQGGATAANAAEIVAAAAKVGAFPITAGSLNAALLVTLDPGAYTATVTAADSSRGAALLEVYELPASSSALLTQANQARIQQVVDNAIRNYEIPGIMYSVKFRGESPWSQARGLRDRATGQALMPEDCFRIGSASKTFIGAAVLKAVEEKRLNLETTIDRLLPADVLSNYQRNQISVRMLLNHTSGISNYTSIVDAWFMPYIENRTRIWTDRELVQLVNSRYNDPDPELARLAPPGVTWHYSNTNTVLLGMILERLLNQPIRQIIQQQFLTPLGLSRTIYPAPGESVLPEPYARGYMNWANFTHQPSLSSADLDVSIYDPSGVGPAGAMVSTTGDLARWIEALATQPVGSASLRRGHFDWKYFFATGSAASSYGFCIAHETDSTNSADYWIVGHRGQISGYDTAMMYLPEQETAVVVACNRSMKFGPGFPTNALAVALNAIVEILFPRLITDNRVQLSSGAEVSEQASVAPRREASQPRFTPPLSEY